MTLRLFARHTVITMGLAGGVVEKTVIVVSPPVGQATGIYGPYRYVPL